MTKTLTAILIREGDGFSALCPELDVASQGNSAARRAVIACNAATADP